MTAAQQKRYRQRRNAGRACRQIETDVVGLEHLLETVQLLAVGGEHSHAALDEALEDFLTILIAATDTAAGERLLSQFMMGLVAIGIVKINDPNI